MSERQSRRERRGNKVTFIVVLVGALVIGAIKADDKWLSALFMTGGTFAGMISFYRRLWRSSKFWWLMAGLFLVHLLMMWVLFGVALRQRSDVPLLVCVPGAFLECFVIYHAVRFVLGGHRDAYNER